jgi:hypothetical protein
VVSKLYEVHRSAPDAHITVSNELRDQFARALKADEASRKAGDAPLRTDGGALHEDKGRR